MSESGESKSGCGCFGCLLELVGFILICYICGCHWARECVVNCVRDVHKAWISVGGESK